MVSVMEDQDYEVQAELESYSSTVGGDNSEPCLQLQMCNETVNETINYTGMLSLHKHTTNQ